VTGRGRATLGSSRYTGRQEARVNRRLTENFDKLDKNNDNKLDKAQASFQGKDKASK